MSKKFELQSVSSSTQPFPQLQDRGVEAKESIYALAEADAFRDMLRAAITKQALDNTALLAAVKDRYDRIAPGASNEYRWIIEAYAKASMMRILGGT